MRVMNFVRVALALSLLSTADAKTFQNKNLELRGREDSESRCGHFCLYELGGEVIKRSYNNGILRMELEGIEVESFICPNRMLGFISQAPEELKVYAQDINHRDGMEALRILDSETEEVRVYGCFLDDNVFSMIAFDAGEEGMVLHNTSRIGYRRIR